MSAEELAPKDMHRLLVRSGCRPASGARPPGAGWRSCLGDVSGAAYAARKRGSSFESGPGPPQEHIQECLAWRPEEQADLQRRRMRKVLGFLAVKGFAPISSPNEKVAEVISQKNVGGVVKVDSLEVGLPPEAWGGAKYGLVPATQSMRLALAKKLITEARSRSDGEAIIV